MINFIFPFQEVAFSGGTLACSNTGKNHTGKKNETASNWTLLYSVRVCHGY